MAPFDRLSSNLKQSLRIASILAKRVRAGTDVYPIDIFVGVLVNSESIASEILRDLGVSTDKVLELFYPGVSEESLLTELHAGKQDLVKLSSGAEDVLKIAFIIAKQRFLSYVGSEHVLEALMGSENSDMKKLFKTLNLDPDLVMDTIRDKVSYPIGLLFKPPTSVPSESQALRSNVSTFGVDLVELAKAHKLDPVIGREEEIEKVIKVLTRYKKNNPIIIGEAGVGKTSLIEGLAQKIATGDVPSSLMDKKIFLLDIASIIASSKLRGDVEEKTAELIKEVITSKDIILFIDEIHNIISPMMPGGGFDIASLIKPALMHKDFRVIGATTTQEFSKTLENDNALLRRFQPIVIDEPSKEETLTILKTLAPIISKHHNGVEIDDAAIEAAVRLSSRYISDRYQPDKAIDLLDAATAQQQVKLEYPHAKEEAWHRKNLLRVDEELNRALNKGDFGRADKLEVEKARIVSEVKKIMASKKRSLRYPKYRVTENVIKDVVSSWTGIPVGIMGSSDLSKIKDLEENLSRKVVGQKDAVFAVASAIKRARVGIAPSGRPWASFLFLGPTGVGKTELARNLSSLLFGTEDRLIQIDMSEMMEMHSVSKLIGSPPGYVGYLEGGQLTEKIRKQPHSVILFDEIEKAHEDVLNILLQILEYGHLTDSKGRRVNFKNTVIILTSNIGAEEIRKDRILGFANKGQNTRSDREIIEAYESMRNDLLKELKDSLRPELLNRLDDVIIFKSLTRQDARKIILLLVEELNKRLAERNINVILDRRARSFILKEGFSEEYGARPLRRTLQNFVENAIADYMLEHRELLERGSADKPLDLVITADDKGGVKVVG